MKVKLSAGAIAPERKNPTDAGADLFSPISIHVPARGSKFVDTGVTIQLPKDHVGLVFARSGLGSKFGIRPRNCVGVIDEKYRGTLGVMVENGSDDGYSIQVGDRIAQLVVVPVNYVDIEVVDELDLTDDRGGGFGSTGK